MRKTAEEKMSFGAILGPFWPLGMTISKYMWWARDHYNLKHVSFYFKSTLNIYFKSTLKFYFKSTLNILFQIHSQILFQIHSGVFILKVNCSSPRWSFTWQLSQILSQKCMWRKMTNISPVKFHLAHWIVRQHCPPTTPFFKIAINNCNFNLFVIICVEIILHVLNWSMCPIWMKLMHLK